MFLELDSKVIKRVDGSSVKDDSPVVRGSSEDFRYEMVFVWVVDEFQSFLLSIEIVDWFFIFMAPLSVEHSQNFLLLNLEPFRSYEVV